MTGNQALVSFVDDIAFGEGFSGAAINVHLPKDPAGTAKKIGFSPGKAAAAIDFFPGLC